MNSPKDSGPRSQNWLTALSIPMVLLVLPAAGAYLGLLADRRFGSQPAGAAVGLLAGLAAAGFRVRAILRNLK